MFKELKEILDKIGLIPPLINIVIEYSKCWRCHDEKQSILNKHGYGISYDDPTDPSGRRIVIFTEKTILQDICTFSIRTFDTEQWTSTSPIESVMHVDKYAYLTAHQIHPYRLSEELPYHTL